MAIILDADLIIAGERGQLDLQSWLAVRADDEFHVAAITVAELWHGVERAKGKQRSKRERFLRAVLGVLPVIPYTEQTAYEHARLWAKLQTAGTMIGSHDLIVAATAVEHDLEVATFNQREFRRVPGLKVIVPSV